MNLLAEGLAHICTADKTAAFLIEPRFDEVAELLTRYMDEIERFNPMYGLVKTDGGSGRSGSGRETLIVKHILDSLAPLGHLARILEQTPSDKALADAGSGAGLPGIPLAICLRGMRFTLIERMGRRANFLRNVLAVLGLLHVTVEETELERAPPGRFDLVTLRAVSPLTPAFTTSLFRLLRQGGIIAAYKGRRETAEAELAGLSELPCTTELVPLTVPFLNEERCLALIKRN